mgnify:CR=1 FL=1
MRRRPRYATGNELGASSARALEGRVDLGYKLVPEADAPGFVPAEGLLDVRFRRAEDDESHFEPRMRALASDQLLNDAAFALSRRRSSSSLCHSGAGASWSSESQSSPRSSSFSSSARSRIAAASSGRVTPEA